MARIVIALGGNALGNNPREQEEKIAACVPSFAALINEGHELILSHGNGPQVGMILSAFETASKIDPKIPMIELPECTAMSQGYIGFHLQKALRQEFERAEIKKTSVTLVTQVIVSEDDEAFKNPTKPIGTFFTKEEAESIMEKNPSFIFKDDAGRGYRRMVASPKPVDIVEREDILALLEKGCVIIAGGGGGIPVIKKDGKYSGIPAVIDKDFASAKLAEIVEADKLIILTAVPNALINFGKEGETAIKTMTIEEAKEFSAAGHFKAGSMLPKVEAAISFVAKAPKAIAIIGALWELEEILKGNSGTIISA